MFGMPEHKSVGREHDKNIYWNDIHVVLAGRNVIRESHAVILRDKVVPVSQVPFPGEPSHNRMGPDEPGQLCPEEMTAWDFFSHP